jgi:hypothetical protein
MQKYNESLTPEQLSYYSFNGHLLFDKDCETMEDLFSSIHMSICKEFTTADFELEKYLWFKKDICVYYICKYFADRIQDWKHLLVSAIYAHSNADVLFMLLFTYSNHHGKFIEIDPTKDDVLYAVFLSHNYDALMQLRVQANIEQKWFDMITKSNSNMNIVRDLFRQWNEKDATNPRNLFYAIFREEVDTAIGLLENGARADIWNNQLMNRVLVKPSLRKNNRLVKLMLECGGSLKPLLSAKHTSHIFPK